MNFNLSSATRVLALAIAAILLPLFAPGVTRAQNTGSSYEALLLQASERGATQRNLDETNEALAVFAEGAGAVSPGEILNRLKAQFPKAAPDSRIGVPPEIRELLILKGKDYDRLVRAVMPLLRDCSLEGHVTPILYRSERPVIALSWPNALIVSTRALDILTADEIEGMSAHEICHLIARELFRRAIDNHDDRTLRLLELFCDAGGAAILSARGKDPATLLSALNKAQDVLRVEYGEEDGKGDHPTLKTRTALNRTLRSRFALVVATN